MLLFNVDNLLKDFRFHVAALDHEVSIDLYNSEPVLPKWQAMAYAIYCNGGNTAVSGYGITSYDGVFWKRGLEQHEAFALMEYNGLLHGMRISDNPVFPELLALQDAWISAEMISTKVITSKFESPIKNKIGFPFYVKIYADSDTLVCIQNNYPEGVQDGWVILTNSEQTKLLAIKGAAVVWGSPAAGICYGTSEEIVTEFKNIVNG